MKNRIGYLFWIFLLAFGLMVLMAVTQLLAKENINGLKKGNRDAALTFTINNRLQDLVNLSFELEAKIGNAPQPSPFRQSLVDSVTALGYNANVFSQIHVSDSVTEQFVHLNKLVSNQVNVLTGILNFLQKNETKKIIPLTDSLKRLKTTDSVYALALNIQKFLEKDLQVTLNNNTAVSSRLSGFNKAIAIIAIAAIVILGTIIINRHLRQLRLIAELEKAKTDAQQLAKIKEQFLANMSHEIRTPLNAIKGFNKLMSQTPLSQEQKKYTSIIKDASDNLIYIVNDILDISKIEAGKMRIENRAFNPQRILERVENIFSPVAVEKGLQFVIKNNGNLPHTLSGDPDRLLQIVVNLVSNAIKFTNEGFVMVTAQVNKIAKDKVWLAFTVADSGPGIPGDKTESIFGRFEQISNSDQLIKGTGLGLDIVRNLAQLMGGTIGLDSQIGEGSSFTVELPFQLIENEQKVQSEEIGNTSILKFERASILIVEDNKVNQLLLEHVLKQSGLQTAIAANGEQALSYLNANNPALIFLDIQMPVLDGYATIKKIREELKLTIPVVAMTAYAIDGEREKCLQAGMNGYIAKPIDFELLGEVLQKYLVVKEKREIADDGGKENNGYPSYLLKLAGGDIKMVEVIVDEINNDIPKLENRLMEFMNGQGSEKPSSFLHYMVSTFAPLGPENDSLKEIQRLRADFRFQQDTLGLKEAEEIKQILATLKKEMEELKKMATE